MTPAASASSIDDMVRHSVARALDLFGIDAGIVDRWGEQPLLATANTRGSAKSDAP